MYVHPCAVLTHCNGDGTRLLIDFISVKYTVSIWLWSNREYVGIGVMHATMWWWMNEFECVITWCMMHHE